MINYAWPNYLNIFVFFGAFKLIGW